MGRSASKPAKVSALYDQALQWFKDAWRKQYGVPYAPTGGDRSQLGRMLQPLTADLVNALPAAFAAYCASGDTFEAEKQRHSLQFFCTSGGLNKYRAVAKTAGFTEREIRGATAAELYLAERKQRGGAI